MGKRVFLLPCYIILLMLVSSCFSKGNQNTFVYCSEGSPSAFNPQITTDGTSNNAAAHTIFDRLVEFKYGTTEVVPALAKDWEISSDQKVYTFHLRKGVKFHQTKNFKPTRPFNADDVLFSIRRQMKKDHPYYDVSGGNYEYFNAMGMGKLIKDIEKVDDYTVKFHLKRPEAPFLANMAMSFMSIHSKEYAEHLAKKDEREDIDMVPVGTGPFALERYRKDNSIRYKRFENYWDEKPGIENLVFSITPDASVRTQKLKAGECHLIIHPSPADLPSMKKDSQIRVKQAPGMNIGYLAMNTQKEPYNNVKVRRALNYALNKKAYIDAIYMGHAQVAKNPLPPRIWSYHKDAQGYSYNPEKARELLREAGYPNGFKTELWTLPVTRPYNPNGKKMGEMMQADLDKIGVEAKILTYDWPTYLNKSRRGEHELIQLGWTGDNGDPDNFLHVLLGCGSVEAGSNVSRWCYEPFDKLIMRAKVLTEQKKRAELYKKAQSIFQKRVPWVPIAHSTLFRAMRKNVKGYKIDPLGGDIFSHVELK